MGKHESIEVEPNSATEIQLSTPPVSSMDPAVTPRMALAGFDAPSATARIDPEQFATSLIQASKTEPEQIEPAGIDAPDVIPQIEELELSDPQPPRYECRVGPRQRSRRTPAALRRGRTDFTVLAASLALAAALGGMAGALAAYSLAPAGPPAAAVAGKTVIEEIHALKENVVQARVELAALKVSLDAFNRTANAQFTRIGERIERIDRNQAEPAAKLNKAIETLERMSRADITGSASPQANAGVPSQSGEAELWSKAGWCVTSIAEPR